MELDYFKDHLFDLINESSLLDIKEIICADQNNVFLVLLTDGAAVEVACHMAETQKL